MPPALASPGGPDGVIGVRWPPPRCVGSRLAWRKASAVAADVAAMAMAAADPSGRGLDRVAGSGTANGSRPAAAPAESSSRVEVVDRAGATSRGAVSWATGMAASSGCPSDGVVGEAVPGVTCAAGGAPAGTDGAAPSGEPVAGAVPGLVDPPTASGSTVGAAGAAGVSGVPEAIAGSNVGAGSTVPGATATGATGSGVALTVTGLGSTVTGV